MSIRSTFFGIEIGKTGIMISQKGLDVTGHNIANVDTAGYTRQRLVTTSYEPYAGISQFQPIQKGRVGAGVTVKILDQIRDAFLDRQYRSEQNIYSEWEARVQGLTYIEALLEGDSITDITTGLKNLFTAFNDLTKEPYDAAQRTVLQQRAMQLAEDFAHTYDRLQEMRVDQDLCVETVVTRINSITDQIAALNESVFFFEMDGQPANDLRDKRNLLIDELCGYADVEYYEDNQGKLIVTLGGEELVNHKTVNKLTCRESTAELLANGDGVNIVCWEDPSMGGIDGALDMDKIGGTLRAHIELRDSDDPDHPGIPYFIENLDTLVRALVQQVNEQHRKGYTHPTGTAVDGNGDPTFTGVDFFHIGRIQVAVDDGAGGTTMIWVDDYDSLNAGNIRLSDAVKSDINNIAASSELVSFALDANGKPDPTTLKTGNNENAKSIYDIYNAIAISLSYLDSDGNAVTASIGNLTTYLNKEVLDISVSLNHAKTKLSTQTTLLLATDTQRTSIAGVSLDEEMTNLIKYQHAYSGSSRVITAMDEALETLINKMGLVGRS